jgi:transcription elongation factor GreB
MSEKNYITPQGMKRLKEEALNLIDHERPELVKVIQWAASNGDRSENGDYIYGKKRLREIDKRIRFLTKKLDAAVVIDPSTREQTDQIFFGATVTVERESGATQTVSIVGIDETNAKQGLISWVSPLAKSLFKARIGDSVTLRSPKGNEELYVVSVDYREIKP